MIAQIVHPVAIAFRLARPALISTGALFLASALANSQTPAPAQAAPSQPPAWQTAAGGHMSFDLASIHPAEPGTFLKPNIVLNNEDTPVPAGGLFIADFPLQIFIEFAYKIMPTHEQEESMLAHQPGWIKSDHFLIRAQFTGSPTKDQIRLMMQSLLEDRFKLAVHFEAREMPVLVLVLDKPGKIGPRLRPHSEGLACDVALNIPPDRTSPSVPPGGFLPSCGRVQVIDGPNQTVLLGARNITFDHLVGYLPDFEDVGRPIVDQTGLDGAFDFSLNWLPEHNSSSSAAASQQTDAQGPTFFEALKDQLGLKLKPTRTPIRTLVIDHVEQPSPN